MTTISPSQLAYQQSHSADFNADGLSAFCIAGEVIVVCAVALRFYSRRISRVALEADDWTLLVATILSVTAVILFDVRVYHWGMGRHFYSLPLSDREKFEKIDYAFNLFYTTGYPLSRISLVLLYRRIFVQKWFRGICWFFFSAFASYMIATIIIDSMLDYPVAAYWDPNITPKRTVNLVQLYIANAAFNIATDSMLLILPLTIIWRLTMSWQQKLGLTAVFSMGTLTLVASIARLVWFPKVDRNDISYTLIPIVWWTSAELFLGILCPCLVTFRPLFRAAQSIITTHISSRFTKSSNPSSTYTNNSGKPTKTTTITTVSTPRWPTTRRAQIETEYMEGGGLGEHLPAVAAPIARRERSREDEEVNGVEGLDFGLRDERSRDVEKVGEIA